jgi:hypothetical protein
MRKRVLDQAKWMKDFSAMQFGEELLKNFSSHDLGDFNVFA